MNTGKIDSSLNPGQQSVRNRKSPFDAPKTPTIESFKKLLKSPYCSEKKGLPERTSIKRESVLFSHPTGLLNPKIGRVVSSSSVTSSPTSSNSSIPNHSLTRTVTESPFTGSSVGSPIPSASSSSKRTSPIVLPPIASLSKEYAPLDTEYVVLTSNNVVERYELAYVIKDLKQKMQNLREKASTCTEFEENLEIERSLNHKISVLEELEKKYNYMEISQKRVLSQLYDSKISEEPDFFMEATEKGLKQEILRAETFLKISIIAEQAAESSIPLLKEEKERLDTKTQNLLNLVNKNQKKININIGF